MAPRPAQFSRRDAHHHLGRKAITRARTLSGASHPHVSVVQCRLTVSAVPCCEMTPPTLQAGPFAMPELPSWVSLPEDGPTRKAYFEVYRPGYSLKERVELGEAAATIFGRNPDDGGVVCDHPSISRKHAAILHDGAKGKLMLYDLGSTHGTFLEGERVAAHEPLPLAHGSHVKFAESSRIYTLHIPGEEKEVPQSTSVSAGGVMPPPAVKKAAPTVAFMPPPPRPGTASASAPVRKPVQEKETDGAPMDDEVRKHFPVSFGGSRKTGGGGALSKEAMAAGIAEMMATIQTTEASAVKRGRDDEEGVEDQDEDEESSDDEMGPRPASSTGVEEEEGQGESEPASEEDAALRQQIPISHEVGLRGHHKSVTALAMDPAGSRVAVGAKDYLVLLYDFGGMDRTGKAFREVEPEEGNPVVALSFSPTGDRFLVATGSSQPKIFNRDGVLQMTFVKGDPYLADMANTKGHTMICTGAQWHPSLKNVVMTASMDGTVRIWDLEGPLALDKLVCKKVIKVRSQRNLVVPVTCAAYSPSGDWVAAGAQDGSIQLFNMKKTSWMRADILIRPGHSAEVTSVAFSPDGKSLVTRAHDDSIKLWDIRVPARPALLKTFSDFPTFLDFSNAVFSPDGAVICAGTNVIKNEGTGVLKFFDVQGPSTEPLMQIGVAPEASVTQVLWHPRIKQVVCGNSTGGAKILYNPAFSVKGALLSASRVKRSSDPSDFVSPGVMGKIVNPHALPMFRDEAQGRRKKIKIRQDPILSKKPEQPVNGPGAQGRLSGVSGFTQFVMANVGKQNTMREQDARDEILKFAEKAKTGMQLVGRAYKTTAPVQALQAKTLEQEIEEAERLEREILKK